jgi:2-amino-4-hydroxy-6-hydroxymethyldihydropteridine diphosphokinase
MHQACLLLGSNIQPELNIPKAINLLQEQLTILQASSVWQTASVICCYPDYLNLALLVSVSQTASALKEEIIRPLEAKLGRVRTDDKNANREIDCDIIIFDGQLLDPPLWKHAHRAVPVAQILPDYRSEAGETLAQVAQHLADTTPIKLRSDVRIEITPTESHS